MPEKLHKHFDEIMNLLPKMQQNWLLHIFKSSNSRAASDGFNDGYEAAMEDLETDSKE